MKSQSMLLWRKDIQFNRHWLAPNSKINFSGGVLSPLTSPGIKLPLDMPNCPQGGIFPLLRTLVQRIIDNAVDKRRGRLRAFVRANDEPLISIQR